MGRFLNAVRHGIQAAEAGPEAGRFSLQGKSVVCGHCGHDQFIAGRALLNTVGMTFLRLDWANQSATTLACADCGKVEWFLQAPEAVA